MECMCRWDADSSSHISSAVKRPEFEESGELRIALYLEVSSCLCTVVINYFLLLSYSFVDLTLLVGQQDGLQATLKGFFEDLSEQV